MEADLDPHPVQALVEEVAEIPTEGPEAVLLVAEGMVAEPAPVPTVEVMPGHPTVVEVGMMVAMMHHVPVRRRRLHQRVARAAFGWYP